MYPIQTLISGEKEKTRRKKTPPLKRENNRK
jgi:hypothetical protein